MPPEQEPLEKIDLRVYIGMVLFRWQMIALFFLWCLLGGVLYLQLVPKRYRTACRLMIYRERNLDIGGGSTPWRSSSSHTYLLTSGKLRGRVVKGLMDEWGEVVGVGKMMLYVNVRRSTSLGPTLDVAVEGPRADYGEAFLSALLKEHQLEWQGMERETADSAVRLLEEELSKMEEKIRKAEDDLMEYQRLNDVVRVDLWGQMEASYLQGLVSRRSSLSTARMMLESLHPQLKKEDAGVISDVYDLTRATGEIDPMATGDGAGDGASDSEDRTPENQPEQQGWAEQRVRLERLRVREADLIANLKEEHPQVKDVRDQIERLVNDLDLAAQTQLKRLQDRHKALTLEINALEAAEYKWQAKNLMAAQRRAELKRIASVVTRFEGNYRTLYERLHNLRVSEELKREYFHLVEPVNSASTPTWPDPMKILMVALTLGLGSGVGLALLAQVFDNKVQSIHDVEKVLGVPFLGGVPYWVHSGLEKTIRPIVTEEHSSGAVEAYRALRTNLISALSKVNEKIVFVTSADSREGKTLTALNTAIMIAQMHKKVLLVDMDLRRGRLHRSLGLEREPGVTDILREAGSLRDVIVSTRVENLWLAPVGSSIENSAELLQSVDLVGMFVEIQDDYDYILIDTSPVLRVTDTVILATRGLGVVLYVAHVNRTPKPMIRYSLDMLRDARVLGLIMNSIEMHKISSLYYTYQYPNYAYYSNAYAYGYDHYYGGERFKGRLRKSGGPTGRGRSRLGQWARRTFLPMK